LVTPSGQACLAEYDTSLEAQLTEISEWMREVRLWSRKDRRTKWIKLDQVGFGFVAATLTVGGSGKTKYPATYLWVIVKTPSQADGGSSKRYS